MKSIKEIERHIVSIQLGVETPAGVLSVNQLYTLQSKRNIFITSVYGMVYLEGENGECIRENHVFVMVGIVFPFVSTSNMWTQPTSVTNRIYYDLMKPVYFNTKIRVPSLTDIAFYISMNHDGYYPGVIHGDVLLNFQYGVEE